MRIGIIVAMDKELAQLKKVFADDREIVISKCGVGKVNAAIGAVEMIRNSHPYVIISSGCAGGADTSLSVMDVVVARETTYHDVYCGDNCDYGQVLGLPTRYQAPQKLVSKALELNDTLDGITVREGLTVSGDWFVDSREKMQSIINRFPDATAVDMESCAIAQTCYRLGVPFVSFRVISDVPLSDNKASQYFDFWDRVSAESFRVTRSFVESIKNITL